MDIDFLNKLRSEFWQTIFSDLLPAGQGERLLGGSYETSLFTKLLVFSKGWHHFQQKCSCEIIYTEVSAWSPHRGPKTLYILRDRSTLVMRRLWVGSWVAPRGAGPGVEQAMVRGWHLSAWMFSWGGRGPRNGVGDGWFLRDEASMKILSFQAGEHPHGEVVHPDSTGQLLCLGPSQTSSA